jgi:hypothetical protein
VYLTDIERPGPDGSWQRAMATGPIPLNWQYGDYAPGLPTVGADRICDLGRVTETGPFEILTPFRPTNFNGALSPNSRVRATVQAVAENAPPGRLTLEIAWDGTWAMGAAEMAKHLVIREVP